MKLHLTEREKDCLRCAALGMTSKAAAASLHIAKRTAEHVLFNVRLRFNAASTMQAAFMALAAGLIENPWRGKP